MESPIKSPRLSVTEQPERSRRQRRNSHFDSSSLGGSSNGGSPFLFEEPTSPSLRLQQKGEVRYSSTHHESVSNNAIRVNETPSMQQTVRRESLVARSTRDPEERNQRKITNSISDVECKYNIETPKPMSVATLRASFSKGTKPVGPSLSSNGRYSSSFTVTKRFSLDRIVPKDQRQTEGSLFLEKPQGRWSANQQVSLIDKSVEPNSSVSLSQSPEHVESDQNLETDTSSPENNKRNSNCGHPIQEQLQDQERESWNNINSQKDISLDTEVPPIQQRPPAREDGETELKSNNDMMNTVKQSWQSRFRNRPWQRDLTCTNLDSWQSRSRKPMISANTYFAEEKNSPHDSTLEMHDEISKEDSGADYCQSFSNESISSSSQQSDLKDTNKIIQTNSYEGDLRHMGERRRGASVEDYFRSEKTTEEFVSPSPYSDKKIILQREKSISENLIQQTSEDSSLYIEDALQTQSQNNSKDVIDETRQVDDVVVKRDQVSSRDISCYNDKQRQIQDIRNASRKKNSFDFSATKNRWESNLKGNKMSVSPNVVLRKSQTWTAQKDSREEQDEASGIDKKDKQVYRDPGSQGKELYSTKLAKKDSKSLGGWLTKGTKTAVEDDSTSPNSRAWVDQGMFEQTPLRHEKSKRTQGFDPNASFDPFTDFEGLQITNSQDIFSPTPDPFVAEESFSPVQWEMGIEI